MFLGDQICAHSFKEWAQNKSFLFGCSNKIVNYLLNFFFFRCLFKYKIWKRQLSRILTKREINKITVRIFLPDYWNDRVDDIFEIQTIHILYSICYCYW